MGENDAGASNIHDYLIKLLYMVWEEEEGFSGKRPFGNSSWQFDVYIALGRAGYMDCKLDEDGYIETCDSDLGDKLILEAIKSL